MPTLTPDGMRDIFDNANFDTVIKQLMEEWDVPGLAITIVPDASNHTPLFKSYGTAYGGVGVTEQTRFPICSLQKHMTAITLLRILEKHGLDQHTPIGDILPAFKLQNETESQRVTLGHALALATGLPLADVAYTDPAAINDMVGYLSTIPSTALPGSTRTFSNYMYDIVALAMEELEQRSFQTLLREDVFEPLGMDDTSFSGVAGEGVAMGLIPRLEDGQLVPGSGIVIGTGPNSGVQSLVKHKMVRGACGLISSTADMAKWVAILSTNQYFPIAAAAVMSADDPSHPGGTLHDRPLTYGLGLFQASHASIPFYETYGATAGYRSYLTIIPSLGISIVVLANSEEATEVGALVKYCAMGLGLDEVMIAMRKERSSRHQFWTTNMGPIVGIPLQDGMPLGTYSGPGLGLWHITKETYTSTRPECTNIPYLPWLYGACLPVLTPVQGGFEGYIRRADVDGKVYHGQPFRCVVVGDDLHITGACWGERGDLCVLRRL